MNAQTTVCVSQTDFVSTLLEASSVIATRDGQQMDQHALILMSAHWKQTIATLMQTAPTPLEVLGVIATRDLLEMEQHAMILMSAH